MSPPMTLLQNVVASTKMRHPAAIKIAEMKMNTKGRSGVPVDCAGGAVGDRPPISSFFCFCSSCVVISASFRELRTT